MHSLPKIGTSACLLGDEVRYNGGHKQDRIVKDIIAHSDQVSKFCPEVGVGLSIPRPAIRMIQTSSGDVKISGIETEDNLMQRMSDYADGIQTQIEELSGFIFMQKSPSCGLYSAKVYAESGYVEDKRAGAFAQRLTELNPLLPVEEAGRLHDAGLRESFLSRVFAYQEWKSLDVGKHQLIDFHSRHKYQLFAHSPVHYKKAGQLLSDLKSESIEVISSNYIAILLEGLSQPLKRGRVINVLQHLMGYIRNDLALKSKIKETIESYTQRTAELSLPLEFIRYASEVQSQTYLQTQTIWEPYPKQLYPYKDL
jgi:uncharacterized protein YbbK (DUF523 family)/uncharacterized protein YbgA (DUF1722 family)